MAPIINIQVPLHTQVIKLMSFAILSNKFNCNLWNVFFFLVCLSCRVRLVQHSLVLI